MARVLEIEGETVDQALYLGLEQMKLSIDEIEMEVLEYGKKGFIGIGAKPARVRLTEREVAVVPDFVANKDKPKEKSTQPRREHRDKGDRGDRGDRYERHSSRNNKPEDAEAVVEAEKKPYFPEGTEFVENEVTAFLQGLMERVGVVNGSVQAAENENGLLVNLTGDNMGLLIGRRGDTLDAVQYLASLVYNKGHEGYKRVTVDTENYRKKRENILVKLAHKKAVQVARTGKRVVLEPMSPFERRIIHFALQNDKYVTTYSEGEEPNRHIVIDKKQ